MYLKGTILALFQISFVRLEQLPVESIKEVAAVDTLLQSHAELLVRSSSQQHMHAYSILLLKNFDVLREDTIKFNYCCTFVSEWCTLHGTRVIVTDNSITLLHPSDKPVQFEEVYTPLLYKKMNPFSQSFVSRVVGFVCLITWANDNASRYC